MVKLRLRRTGKKGQPCYQIVAVDSRFKRDGGYLEKIGHYYPLNSKHDVNAEKALKWLNVGAQPTLVVRSLLKKNNILSLFHQKRTSILSGGNKTKKV